MMSFTGIRTELRHYQLFICTGIEAYMTQVCSLTDLSAPYCSRLVVFTRKNTVKNVCIWSVKVI